MNERKIRFFLYARKSSESDERQVQSIGDQLAVLQRMIEAQGLNIVDTITESKSAKEPRGRTEFNSMIERIDNGEADGILTWHINRLSRNPVDSGTIQWLLQSDKVKVIRTAERDYRPEDNALILSVETGMSNQYIRDLSKGVKRGLASKVEKGWRPGGVPHGYRNTKFPERGTNEIIEDPEVFPIIRKMWDYMLTGNCGPTEMLSILKDEWGFRTRQTKKRGGVPLSKGGLYRMLNNSFYAGYINYGGVHKKGAHAPMVTDEEFDRMQILLGKEGKPRPHRYEYAYNGVLKCGDCGGYISATFKEKLIQSTKETKSYTLYYCTNAQRNKCTGYLYVNVETIEEAIERELASITIIPEFRDWAIAILEEVSGHKSEEQKVIDTSRQKTLARLKMGQGELLNLKLAQMITDEEFTSKRAELGEEIADMEKLIATNGNDSAWIELTRETFEFAVHARAAFTNGDAKTRRQILQSLSGLNCTLKDGIPSIQAAEWFEPIKRQYPAVEAEYRLLEPELSRISGTKSAFEHFSPVMRGRRDLNPQPPA